MGNVVAPVYERDRDYFVDGEEKKPFNRFTSFCRVTNTETEKKKKIGIVPSLVTA